MLYSNYLHGFEAKVTLGSVSRSCSVKKEGRGGWGRTSPGQGSPGPGMNTKWLLFCVGVRGWVFVCVSILLCIVREQSGSHGRG